MGLQKITCTFHMAALLFDFLRINNRHDHDAMFSDTVRVSVHRYSHPFKRPFSALIRA